MDTLLETRPRSLDELAEVIRDALAKAEKAGMEWNIIAGEAMVEAHDYHFRKNLHGFWAWVERNFDYQRTQATRIMNYARRPPAERQAIENIAESERKLGRSPKGESSPKRAYHEPVEKILDTVDTEALRREAVKRRDELDQIRDLKEKIINVGYKTLASKLHPDVKGGSRHAMTLLNAARDGLKRHI